RGGGTPPTPINVWPGTTVDTMRLSTAGGAERLVDLGIKDITTQARQTRARTEAPKAIIVHHTGGATLKGAVKALNDQGYAYQYIVDTDGTIYQFVPTERYGAHALPGKGLSNATTIGISAVGTSEKTLNPVQIDAMRRLAAALGRENNIPPSMVFGHGEVNPGHRAI